MAKWSIFSDNRTIGDYVADYASIAGGFALNHLPSLACAVILTTGTACWKGYDPRGEGYLPPVNGALNVATYDDRNTVLQQNIAVGAMTQMYDHPLRYTGQFAGTWVAGIAVGAFLNLRVRRETGGLSNPNKDNRYRKPDF